MPGQLKGVFQHQRNRLPCTKTGDTGDTGGATESRESSLLRLNILAEHVSSQSRVSFLFLLAVSKEGLV